MESEVQKLTIMGAMEKIRDERPIIILWGKDIRKSSSKLRDVMVWNTNNDVVAETRNSALDSIKSINTLSFKNIGKLVFWLLPPRTVIAAANIIITIKIAGTVQEEVVSLIQFFAWSTKPLWFSTNKSWGVKPSSFSASIKEGLTMLFTSCVY